jgi:hypothetical protein
MTRWFPDRTWERIAAAVAAIGLAFAGGVAAVRLIDRPDEPTGPVPDEEFEKDFHKKLFDSFVETAAASVERSRNSAQFIQGAAIAISGLYTGALGLVFAVGTNPLPVRGVVPTVFLGAAIALAAFYLAFLTRGKSSDLGEPTDKLPSPNHALNDAVMFIDWIGEAVNRRAPFLRAAVVSLAIGVLLLPVPFVSIHTSAVAQDVTADDAALVVPEPQFDAPVVSVELAEIAYQARVDHYVASLEESAPADDRAENEVALWATVIGVVIVALTYIISADLDRRARHRGNALPTVR